MVLLAMSIINCKTLMTFSFSTEPSGAKMYLDGEYMGVTPIEKEFSLRESAYLSETTKLLFKKKGYKNLNTGLYGRGGVSSSTFSGKVKVNSYFSPRKKQHFFLEK